MVFKKTDSMVKKTQASICVRYSGLRTFASCFGYGHVLVLVECDDVRAHRGPSRCRRRSPPSRARPAAFRNPGQDSRWLSAQLALLVRPRCAVDRPSLAGETSTCVSPTHDAI